MELDYVQAILHPQMERLKERFFRSHPDEPIILHRKDILNSKGEFRTLINETTRKEFDEQLLIYLREWQYHVITVCIDKKKHKETYTTWRYDPYHYCLAILLERFIFFLGGVGQTGDVMAESRGGKEDIRLKHSFEGLMQFGTDYIDPNRFQNSLTSRKLKIKPKINNISGLQLADIIAHPSRNEILNEQGLLQKEIAPFAKQVIGIRQDKYYQHHGKIFGKKFI